MTPADRSNLKEAPNPTIREKAALLRAVCLLLAGLFPLLLSACIRDKPKSRPVTTLTPGADPVKACQAIVKQILNAPTRDILIAKSTPAFSRMLAREFTPTGRIDYDPRFDTQDEMPLYVGTGRTTFKGNKIQIPVNFVFPENTYRDVETPMTKTFVFVRLNGRWMLEDILSSGPDTPVPGSLRSEID
jgi:hypothetical protein